jgi:two-component system phosphate regulon sensor histidine kinase PhoR
VIDFSRIQQGERTYSLAPGSIAPLVARTADRFGEYLAVHDFALRASIDMDVPLVEFDEIAVEQAVLNLLDNAFKYSGESRELAVSVCAQGDRVFVHVRDHGVGIAESDHHRIFERFQRGDHPDRGGYGLGLYLVRHIMAAHGGRVQLVSAPGQGSMFTLEFPIASGAAREQVDREAGVSRETSEVAYVEGAAGRG